MKMLCVHTQAAVEMLAIVAQMDKYTFTRQEVLSMLC